MTEDGIISSRLGLRRRDAAANRAPPWKAHAQVETGLRAFLVYHRHSVLIGKALAVELERTSLSSLAVILLGQTAS